MHIGCWLESDLWEGQDVGGWAILKLFFERWDGVDFIDMTQDRDQWRALVNTILSVRVP
jgi:hypothetical protein